MEIKPFMILKIGVLSYWSLRLKLGEFILKFRARDFIIKVYGDKYVSCSNTKYVEDRNIWASLKEDIERVITNDIYY
jgi:hypothetical protein